MCPPGDGIGGGATLIEGGAGAGGGTDVVEGATTGTGSDSFALGLLTVEGFEDLAELAGELAVALLLFSSTRSRY